MFFFHSRHSPLGRPGIFRATQVQRRFPVKVLVDLESARARRERVYNPQHSIGSTFPTVRRNMQIRTPTTRLHLDKLEGPKYAARRAELRRKAREEARARDRQAAAPSQNEAEESDATEEEATRESTTRRGRPRGGTKVAARIGERLRREIGRGGRPRVGDG